MLKAGAKKLARTVAGLAAGTAIVFSLRYLFSRERDRSAAPKTPGGSPTPSAPKPTRVDPPNISGDPAGYNTTRYPDPASVRAAFEDLGYLDSSAAQVRKFQQDWNKVTASLAGSPEAAQQNLVGSLAVDGVPGKMTLRALEIASKVFDWQTTVAYAG